MIDYQKQISFISQGTYHFKDKAIPAQISGKYKTYSQDPVAIELWSDHAEAAEIFFFSKGYPSLVWFEGITEFGEDIWLMGIIQTQTMGLTRVYGLVSIFIKGDNNYSVKPGEEVKIHIKISPTCLVSPEWTYSKKYDGTITRFGGKEERTGINWENPQGSAKLIDDYEYVKSEDSEDVISLRIQTNSLFLNIKPVVETQLKAILFQLPKFLDDDLCLLAFVGRTKVVCVEATAKVKADGKTSIAFARYQTWSGFYIRPVDQSSLRSLIKHDSLQQGVFALLVANFRQSPYYSVVKKATSYLVASYEDGYMESKLVLAFAALESLVDGIGGILKITNLLGTNQFKQFSKKLKIFINSEITSSEIATGMISKIPELRRRGFLERLLYLIDKYNVGTKFIWPPKTDQSTEMHELLKRRNRLIHTAEIDQSDIPRFDLNRVQKLVELWILRLLECPDDAINKYSLWRDAPIHTKLN